MNTLKTTFLMALGGALGGKGGMTMAERVARLQEMSRMHSY